MYAFNEINGAQAGVVYVVGWHVLPSGYTGVPETIYCPFGIFVAMTAGDVVGFGKTCVKTGCAEPILSTLA